MTESLPFEIQPQPDDRSCGPTCLQAVYRYFGKEVELGALIDDIPQLETGGTLAVQLGAHALSQGFGALILTYNLQLFDPTWFAKPGVDLAERLRKQAANKNDDGRLKLATEQYLEFLGRGGEVQHEVLNSALIRRFLRAGLPVLTGLSSTYLYQAARERPHDDKADDTGGEPVGHFVVLCGENAEERTVMVADPWPEPAVKGLVHTHRFDRVMCSILLGVLTYDANLLILFPKGQRP